MASEHSNVEGLKRLALQLQSLSQLTETLTYRLLQLDERLAAAELTVQGFQAGGGAGQQLAEDTEVRLDDTEARLARLETILRGDQASLGRRLELIDGPAAEPDEVPGMDIQNHAADEQQEISIDDVQEYDVFQVYDASQEPEGSDADEPVVLHGDDDLDQMDHLDQTEERLIA